MTRSLRLVAAAAAALALAAPASALPGPEGFAPRVDNAWFPLEPGATYVYRGVAEGQAVRRVTKVTRSTRTILGVRCAVVDDRLYAGGRLAARTTSWYAQDRRGNVWLLGRAASELDASGAPVSTAGSWEAGVGGGKAGLFMPAKPRVGFTRRQGYLRGQADDRFRVVNMRGAVDTPAVSSRDALVTEEWTPLHPGAVRRKVYVRGIGLVAAGAADDDADHVLLVSVARAKP